MKIVVIETRLSMYDFIDREMKGEFQLLKILEDFVRHFAKLAS